MDIGQDRVKYSNFIIQNVCSARIGIKIERQVSVETVAKLIRQTSNLPHIAVLTFLGVDR